MWHCLKNPWAIDKSFPLPVEVGSLSRWLLWPHNSGSWLSRVAASPTTGAANSYRRRTTVTATAVSHTVTGGEEEEEKERRCSLLPEFLQKYQKGSHDTSAYLGAARAVSSLYQCACMCVCECVNVCWVKEKAWQRQKYRWQYSRGLKCVWSHNKLTECEFLVADRYAFLLFPHNRPAKLSTVSQIIFLTPTSPLEGFLSTKLYSVFQHSKNRNPWMCAHILKYTFLNHVPVIIRPKKERKKKRKEMANPGPGIPWHTVGKLKSPLFHPKIYKIYDDQSTVPSTMFFSKMFALLLIQNIASIDCIRLIYATQSNATNGQIKGFKFNSVIVFDSLQ